MALNIPSSSAANFLILFQGLQHSVIVGSEPYGLGLNETIMPQYFKQLGYATRMVGKVRSHKKLIKSVLTSGT